MGTARADPALRAARHPDGAVVVQCELTGSTLKGSDRFATARICATPSGSAFSGEALFPGALPPATRVNPLRGLRGYKCLPLAR